MGAIIPMSRLVAGPGYVYLAKLSMFKNSYKVGSTCNLPQRKIGLEKYGGIDYICYGYSANRLKCERAIQKILGCKRREEYIPNEYVSAGSREFFSLKDGEVSRVVDIFGLICTSVIYNATIAERFNICRDTVYRRLDEV